MLTTVSAVIATKKMVAVAVAAGVIMSGGVAADASGLTSTVSGHLKADSQVAAETRTDTALATLAAIDADARADAGLETAMNAIVDAQADADVGSSASIGRQVSAEAGSRIGTMAESVLELLGANAGADGDATAAVNAEADAKEDTGADTRATAELEPALEAVGSAHVSQQADAGISTALNAVGGAQTGLHVNGLSTALDTAAEAGAEGNLGVSSVSGPAAEGSAHGSGTLGIGLALGQ